MPFYEYECSACNYYLEALQKISEAPLRKCPKCKKSTLKRLVSAPVFRLKGSGWYETDFKSDQEQKRNLAGSEEAPKDEDKPKSDGQDKSKESEASKSEATPAASKRAAPRSRAVPARARSAGSAASRPAARSGRAASRPAGRAGKAKAAKKAPARKKARR